MDECKTVPSRCSTRVLHAVLDGTSPCCLTRCCRPRLWSRCRTGTDLRSSPAFHSLAIGAYFGGVLPVPAPVLEVVNFFGSFGVITLLFAAIFKVLPDVDNAWSDVWIGAAVTAALFPGGETVGGRFIRRNGLGSTLGAAGPRDVMCP